MPHLATRLNLRHKCCTLYWAGALLLVLPTCKPEQVAAKDLYKVHAVIACDDSKTAWAGSEAARLSVAYDRQNFEAYLQESIPPNRLDLVVLPLNQVHADGILKAIDNVRCGRDDVFLFYYSGHGAFIKNDGYAFTTKNPQVEVLMRKTVQARMQAQNPRLTVILSDCCSNVIDPAAISPGIKVRQPTPTEIPKLVSPLCDVLFNFSGVVDIVSSSETETSLCKSPNAGGFFTFHLLGYLRDNKAQWRTWKDIEAETRRRAQADITDFLRPRGQQHSQTAKGLELGKAPPRLGLWIEKVNEGLVVRQVVSGSPADRGGIRINDRVLRINGKETRVLNDYVRGVDESPSVLTIVVNRNGADEELRVALD